MALAQVVYSISNDREFASLFRSDPESALSKRGLELSKEELNFLKSGIRRSEFDDSIVSLVVDKPNVGGWAY